MTDIVPTDYEDEELESPENTIPLVDTPYDKRPNLEELGIIEIERGICEDTFENRAILRVISIYLLVFRAGRRRGLSCLRYAYLAGYGFAH